MIWLGPVAAAVARQLPHVTAVMGEVQDAQGHLVEDVPVTFAVEPGWGSSMTLAPAQTRTRRGRAQTVVSDPPTTGIVRVLARVDQTTAQARLTVQTSQRKSADEGRRLPGGALRFPQIHRAARTSARPLGAPPHPACGAASEAGQACWP